MALASTELLKLNNRTTIHGSHDFTVDFYRCGKCSKEFTLLEDFICHKMMEENNGLVLWDSEKISGLQIPRFVVTTPLNLHLQNEKASVSHFNNPGKQKLTIYQPVVTNLHAEKLQQPINHREKQENVRTFHSVQKNSRGGNKKHKTTATRSPSRLSNMQQFTSVIAKQKLNKQSPECTICGSIYRDFTTLKTHMTTVHSKNRPFHCSFSSCSCSFKTKASLQRHERRHTGERPFSCEHCGRTFRESGTLSRHLKSRVPCVKKDDSELPRYGKNKSLVSSVLKELSDEVESNDREESSPPETLQIIITQIPESENITSSDQLGTNSNTTKESNPEITSGERLPHQFSQLLEVATRLQPEPILSQSEQLLEEEEESIVVDPPCVLEPERLRTALTQQLLNQNLQCIVCDYQFLQTIHLIQHLQTHLKGFVFRCTKCYFVSKDKASLAAHSRTQHDRSATAKAHLQEDRHWAQEAVMQLLIIHDILDEQAQKTNDSGSKSRRNGSYRCHVCLKKFSGRGYFSLHMGNHTGYQPHSCKNCQKTFISKDALQKHMVTHSQQRLFKCDICSKQFKRPNHIREHLRTHSNEKHYFCKTCDRGFKWHGALKSHELTHDRSVVFVCEVCDRRFRSRSSMKRHARRHMPQPPLAEHTSTIRNVTIETAPSCNDNADDIQISSIVGTETAPAEDQQAYLIILEDGSISLVPDGMVLQSGLMDTTNIWRTQPQHTPQTEQDNEAARVD